MGTSKRSHPAVRWLDHDSDFTIPKAHYGRIEYMAHIAVEVGEQFPNEYLHNC